MPTSSAPRPESEPASTIRARIIPQTRHPLETALFVLVGGELVFLPWALGGMRVWSEVIALVLATAALAVALWPRNYDDRSLGDLPFRLYTWPKLLRFRPFWIGLFILLYITIQALNPAWTYETDGRNFWMRKIPEVAWLPAGMRAPFEQWNPWRVAVVFAAAWLTVCAAWIGFTRRRSWQIVFGTIVANGLVLALIGILQRIKGNGKMLWVFEPSTSYFVATIPYKNHAAAYFNLILTLTAGFSFWYHLRAQRRFEKSSPAPLLAFAATLLAVIVVFTLSRLGAVLMLAFVVAAGLGFIAHQIHAGMEKRHLAIAAGLVILLGGFAWVSAANMRLEQVSARFEHLFKQDRVTSVERREIVRHATWEMARDRLAYGWGAGCYRFGFPIYQLRYKIITYGTLGERVFWEHAHNDYFEFLAEFGVVGSLIILALLASGVDYLVRARFWRNPFAVVASAGLVLTLIHAWADFPFQNPAVLTTWFLILFGLPAWTELDARSEIA